MELEAIGPIPIHQPSPIPIMHPVARPLPSQSELTWIAIILTSTQFLFVHLIVILLYANVNNMWIDSYLNLTIIITS
jgi:hypothetical protein